MDLAVKGVGRLVPAEFTPALMKQLSRPFPCPKTEHGAFSRPAFVLMNMKSRKGPGPRCDGEREREREHLRKSHLSD